MSRERRIISLERLFDKNRTEDAYPGRVMVLARSRSDYRYFLRKYKWAQSRTLFIHLHTLQHVKSNPIEGDTILLLREWWTNPNYSKIEPLIFSQIQNDSGDVVLDLSEEGGEE